MTWPTEGEAVSASLKDQLRSRTPVRVPVPMEEQEARANRFAFPQVERMEKRESSKLSSVERHLSLARLRVLHLRGLLDRAEVELDRLLKEHSDLRTGRTNRTLPTQETQLTSQ